MLVVELMKFRLQPLSAVNLKVPIFRIRTNVPASRHEYSIQRPSCP